MSKFSIKYKKEYLKAKRMLGKNGIKGSHIILGLVALGVVYFVVIKKKGGSGGGMMGGSSGAIGSHVPGSGFEYPVGQIYGLGQAGTDYLTQVPITDLTGEYSNYP